MNKSDSPNPGKMTGLIAEFAMGTADREIPDTALHMARISLFDWMTVSVAGQNEPVSRIVRDYIAAEGGAGDATVFGMAHRFSARAAALANGTISHALDYDDTHFAYLGHPSVAVFPAAFAMAQKTGASGRNFLVAALIGMETATRIGTWLGRNHHLVGFHSTATAGTFGAAMASARLLGLNKMETGYALGLAASCASGVRAQFGTMGKPLHAGIAASNGVEAAILARAGLVSRPDAVEADQGFAITHGAEMRDPAEVFDDLGQSWMFQGVLHKFHACCHGVHASLEALTRARDMLGIKPCDVKGVTLSVPPRYLKVCNIFRPQTGLEAKFSYRLCSAMLLAGRDTAALSAYSDAACKDPDLIALHDRVEVRGVDGLAETEARARVTTNDGRSVEVTHDIDRMASLELRERMIKAKAQALLGKNPAIALWDIVETAEPWMLDDWVRDQDDLRPVLKDAVL